MQNTIQQLTICSLHFHEKVNEMKLRRLMREIQRDRVLRYPVVVDGKTRVVLDGHHRCQVFLRLGMKTIPCYIVNYFDKHITVTFRRPDIKNALLKEIIVQKAETGELFPVKTTKHRLMSRPVINKKLTIPSKRETYSTMKGAL